MKDVSVAGKIWKYSQIDFKLIFMYFLSEFSKLWGEKIDIKNV